MHRKSRKYQQRATKNVRATIREQGREGAGSEAQRGPEAGDQPEGERSEERGVGMTHMECLELRLSNEKIRLSHSKTPIEIKLRKIWIHQIQKEIKMEVGFEKSDSQLSDEDLLNQLGL